MARQVRVIQFMLEALVTATNDEGKYEGANTIKCTPIAEAAFDKASFAKIAADVVAQLEAQVGSGDDKGDKGVDAN